jgi:hypothetical protein
VVTAAVRLLGEVMSDPMTIMLWLLAATGTALYILW